MYVGINHYKINLIGPDLKNAAIKLVKNFRVELFVNNLRKPADLTQQITKLLTNAVQFENHGMSYMYSGEHGISHTNLYVIKKKLSIYIYVIMTDVSPKLSRNCRQYLILIKLCQ
jgi:hypothetical protein